MLLRWLRARWLTIAWDVPLTAPHGRRRVFATQSPSTRRWVHR